MGGNSKFEIRNSKSGKPVMSVDHKTLLNRLLAGKDLSSGEMEAFIGAIMDGGVDDVVMAAMLVALRAKGETGPEVAAAARAMRARSLPVAIADPGLAVDTCGTGGDGAETINISTAAALLAAAAGVPVAKHGNRSVSSRCGSADVLEAAGVRLDQRPEDMAVLHDEIEPRKCLLIPRTVIESPTMPAVTMGTNPYWKCRLTGIRCLGNP